MTINVPNLEALHDFVRYVLDRVWEGGEIDAADTEDEAARLGILVPTIMQERCGEPCPCAEIGDFPLLCHRLAPWFRQLTSELRHEGT